MRILIALILLLSCVRANGETIHFVDLSRRIAVSEVRVIEDHLRGFAARSEIIILAVNVPSGVSCDATINSIKHLLRSSRMNVPRAYILIVSMNGARAFSATRYGGVVELENGHSSGGDAVNDGAMSVSRAIENLATTINSTDQIAVGEVARSIDVDRMTASMLRGFGSDADDAPAYDVTVHWGLECLVGGSRVGSAPGEAATCQLGDGRL